MATGKSGILGSFTGSVGELTMYRLKGTDVIRQKTVNVANPSTPARDAYKANYRFAISIFNDLKPFLAISLKDRAPKMSLLGEFLRLNLNKSIVNSEINFDLFKYYLPDKTDTIIETPIDYYIDGVFIGTII